MANTTFQTQEGNNENMRFLNAKYHTPPEAKANHKQYQLIIHNMKNADHKCNSSQKGVEPSQLKVTSILEMNTMME
jgi:hypothetical protein